MYTGKQGRPSEPLGTCSMGQMACTSEPNWLACDPRNLGYTGRSSEPLGNCSMGQMACPSEPRQTQQGTSILGKPGSTSELVLWPMWPVPWNPTGLPAFLGTWTIQAVPQNLKYGPFGLSLRTQLACLYLTTLELGQYRLYLRT